MLSDFVTSHREDIIVRCRARVAQRMAPRATQLELQGIPLFLDQLAAILRTHESGAASIEETARTHGRELLQRGFNIAQVVHDYGDVCQSITQLAIDEDADLTPAEFRTLNACLDDAIACAVTEYAHLREVAISADDSARATEELGVLAHELRNSLASATLAFDALRSGAVAVGGSTGAVLGRSLTRLRHLVDRSLTAVRLDAGLASPQRVVLAGFLEEIEVGAILDAKARRHQLTIEPSGGDAIVEVDPQILTSIVSNLIGNAVKYSRDQGHIVVRTTVTADRVQITVDDECGGLPRGMVDALAPPFTRGSTDRSGLGLGLAICRRGADAIGARLTVVDRPPVGCSFTVDLPRVA